MTDDSVTDISNSFHSAFLGQEGGLKSEKHRAPSPRSIHFGFEPADPADLNRKFAGSPERDTRILRSRGRGSFRKRLEQPCPFRHTRMQRFNNIGMGARGTALLLTRAKVSKSNEEVEKTPSIPSGAGPSPSMSTPNRRNRALRSAFSSGCNCIPPEALM